MRVSISEITVGTRRRTLREDVVVRLMDRIAQLGLLTPISVITGLRPRPGGGPDLVSFTLVAGLHRLEACRRLGWTEIEAKIVQGDDDECLLWEIDENWCRAELTELERGEHLVKRKAVYERKWPQARVGVSQASSMHQALGHHVSDNLSVTSFAEDTAGKTRVTDRSIQRSIRRAQKINPKVRDRIRDHPEIADNGVELDALAAMDHAQQLKAVKLFESGQAASIRDAQKLLKAKPAKATTQAESAEEANAKWRAKFNAALLIIGTLLLEATPEDRKWARERLADGPMLGAEPPSGRSECENGGGTVGIAPTNSAHAIRRSGDGK